ncbi:Beta-hexosaminidase [Vanrija pseudolonga]|uniref:beta-N-acetylhexosaminidase n=1 Tax=Vanrija pseudolonga TaxID=143232 RepID=A0AAF1BM22_9TREE|nr:Beta-hexosaminidase [Vanrija pseudolonga]
MTTSTPATLLPKDDGAFAYRGVMLDVARHFVPLAEIRRLLDGMQLLKLNVLHIHLTDDQGWRFESLKWPKLTTVGGTRSQTVVGLPGNYGSEDLHPENYKNVYDGKPHSGFYTQAELRELVAHAKTKGVTIVPEIDMPGHMRAARAAYPELGYDGVQWGVGTGWGVYREVLRVDEPGLQFCRDILGEVCDVFDSPYIHIGGDECPKIEWIDSHVANKQVKELGLDEKNIEEYDKLQRWFTAQMATFLASRGRKLLGWDEIIDGGVPGDCVVMAWRSWTKPAERAVKLNVPIVQAPTTLYFDHAHGAAANEPLSIGDGATLQEAYEYDPLAGVEDKPELVLGLQAQLWSEYIPTTEHLWYMAFPRLIAVADIGYYGAKRAPWAEFRAGLEERVKALAALGLVGRPLDKE